MYLKGEEVKFALKFLLVISSSSSTNSIIPIEFCVKDDLLEKQYLKTI